MPVPRSGWIAISADGAPMIGSATTRLPNVGGSGRSLKYHATISGTAIRMISDGWNRGSPGTSSQRCEPLTMTPKNIDRDQQHHPDRIQHRRPPQIHAGFELRRNDHDGEREHHPYRPVRRRSRRLCPAR